MSQSKERLFYKLCSMDVIKVGWHLARADSRDDFVSDPVRCVDFASNLTERLEYLIERIRSHRYRPRHLLEIDIPKSGLSVRPGNVLPIEEATLLHSIVYLLAPYLDKKLHDSVYSYRLHPDWKKRIEKRNSLFREVEKEIPFLKRRTIRSINPFEAWYERWPEFEDDTYRAYTTEGFTHLTKTDITAYFENIDLRLLETQLRTLLKRDSSQIIQLIFRILDGWTRVTSIGTPIGRGIPQGNEISSFLGNLYLVPLDKALSEFCKKHKAKWFRYVDDVKVFTKSEADARAVVFVINDALRTLHLNLQGSKTEILSGEKLRKELDNEEINKVGQAFEAIQKMDSRSLVDKGKISQKLKPLNRLVSRYRRNLPHSIKNLDNKSNRLFRRLMTLYGACQRPHFSQSAIAAMKELPDIRILRKSLSYLSQLSYETHRNSFNQIIDMLENNELPFSYQVGIVLDQLSYFHPKNSVRKNGEATSIRKYLRRPRAHWFVIQKALEAIMTFPYPENFMLNLAEKYLKHDHPYVRRAACVLLLRSPLKSARNRLQKLIYHPDQGLCQLALYFLRFINEQQYAKQELSRIGKSEKSDFLFIRNMPQLYAIHKFKNEVQHFSVLTTSALQCVDYEKNLQTA